MLCTISILVNLCKKLDTKYGALSISIIDTFKISSTFQVHSKFLINFTNACVSEAWYSYYMSKK